jgi:integrase
MEWFERFSISQSRAAFFQAEDDTLRHAFAVRTVRRWQAIGLPINQIADTLATYMGHAEFASTQVYLKALSRGPGDLIFTSSRRG